MNWTAHSNFREVTPGAVLALMVTTQLPGETVPELAVGDTIAFHLALGPAGRGTVVSVVQGGCDFTFDDRTWRMTPRRADEFGSGTATPLAFSEWVVREALNQ